MNLRIYLYKVTFEDIPHWYWGVHKENRQNDNYLGSPVTNSWYWECYTPTLQVCQLFDYSEEGWVEAKNVETRVIKPDLNNPLCLNEACGGVRSLRACSKGGVITAKKNASVWGRIAAQRSNEVQKQREGYREQQSKAGKLGGKATASQRWKCLVTGHVCNAASLTLWQRKRGINVTLRERLS